MFDCCAHRYLGAPPSQTHALILEIAGSRTAADVSPDRVVGSTAAAPPETPILMQIAVFPVYGGPTSMQNGHPWNN